VPPEHDVTNELAAYQLADAPFPGYFGIFRQVQRPTKNALEAKVNASLQAKVQGLSPWQILQQTFDRMK
jgi:2-oxoglutarate/2-oxoacid ferredoxin oxidoreductase subunit beta